MLLAFRCALASPRLTARAIEASEFAEEADRFAVHAVPKVVVDGTAWEGAVPERVFVERLVAALGPPSRV